VTAPQRVTVGDLRRRGDRRSPWLVRWRVDGTDRSSSHPTKAAADRYRRKLLDAIDAGDAFDPATGQPRSWSASKTVLEFTTDWWARRWPAWGGKHRGDLAPNVARVIVGLTSKPPRDDEAIDAATSYLTHHVLCDPQRRADPPAAIRRTARWLERHSLPLNRVTEVEAAQLLDSFRTNKDGSTAKGNTLRARRAAAHQLFAAAVKARLIESNPIGEVEITIAARTVEIDKTFIPTVADGLHLIGLMGQRGRQGARCVAPLSTMLYGGLRPSEVAGLRLVDLDLPAQGWGHVTVREPVVAAKRRYTQDGSSYERRSRPKHRAEGAAREVPIPSVLVAIIQEHLEAYPVANGELVFRNTAGQPWTGNVARAWRAVRAAHVDAVADGSRDHLRAARIYDLRHTNATLLLGAGVPVPEVARRLGHTPETLLRIYAGVMITDEAVANQRIELVLAA
jgi:integrase